MGADSMIDVNGKTIFLSGPMSGIENNNVAAFCDAQATLYQMGASEVYNPAYQWLQMGCPTERPHEYWMVGCIHELSDHSMYRKPHYDMVVTLEGSDDSLGALTERSVARACGIPVYEFADVVGS